MKILETIEHRWLVILEESFKGYGKFNKNKVVGIVVKFECIECKEVRKIRLFSPKANVCIAKKRRAVGVLNESL